MFIDKFDDMLIRKDKLYYSYLGINKKDYPRWPGWKIISTYRDNGVNIKDIKDERLDILVKNFYYTIYLSETFHNINEV